MSVSRRELVMVIAVCGVLGWWSQRAKGPSLGQLQELAYHDSPFQYSVTVKPDGSGEYRASFNCVSATPEPGQLGCQHLDGNLSAKEVGLLRSGLRATHAERFLTTSRPEPGPGAGRTLELKFDGKSATISESGQSKAVFKALDRLHPGAVRKKLESKRAIEERALKSSR